MNMLEDMQKEVRRERLWSMLFMAFAVLLLIAFVVAVLTRS